jgi:hypothetical protein
MGAWLERCVAGDAADVESVGDRTGR